MHVKLLLAEQPGVASQPEMVREPPTLTPLSTLLTAEQQSVGDSVMDSAPPIDLSAQRPEVETRPLL